MSENTRVVGSENGQVKWFNNRLGYGFITVISPGSNNGQDIFVHQSNICPSQSQYRTLTVGEYVSLNISDDDKHQALNVTGINGGSLSCDIPRPRPRPRHRQHGGRRNNQQHNSSNNAENTSQE